MISEKDGIHFMKKRILSTGLALVLALLTCSTSALAAVLTDAPGTPTQDRAISLEARWEDKEKTAYELEALPADQLSMDTVTDIYEFVFEEENRPVRWYPEETQKAIRKMLSIDPDVLYMSEFMRLHAPKIKPPAALDVVLTLTIDYQPGQLTVVVLGDVSDPENIVWTPVKSRVTAVGRIEFTIPQELMKALQNEDVLLSLLTVREGARGTADAEVKENTKEVPSKRAADTTRVVTSVSQKGEQLEDHFVLKIAPTTRLIRREIAHLQQFVKEKEEPALKWLPEEDQNRVRYLLEKDGETDAEELIVSDYTAMITEDFRPTDGDALGTLSFATPYKEGQVIITALGIPKEDADADDAEETQMDWSVQPAKVRRVGKVNVVDVVFDQLALIDMDEETGLLLVLSVPEDEE